MLASLAILIRPNVIMPNIVFIETPAHISFEHTERAVGESGVCYSEYMYTFDMFCSTSLFNELCPMLRICSSQDMHSVCK